MARQIDAKQTEARSASSDSVSCTLAFVGDIMLGRLVNKFANNYGFRYPMDNVAPVLNKADLVFGNLECAITSHEKQWPHTKAFYFHADPIAVDTLKYAGIDYVSLANNHVLDYQEQGLFDTIKHLDKAGIAHAGAGKNVEEAERHALLSAGEMKIAVLSFADHPEDFKATESKPGINYTEISAGEKFGRIELSIEKAREYSDLVVFSAHWGPNMRQRPTKDFIKFAHAVIDAGADIFHGHSAHIFQGIEIYNKKPIFYDCGDFVDDYYVGPGEKNDQQLIFSVKTENKVIKEIELVPLYINMCQVNLAEYEIYDEIAERISELSKEFGTKTKIKDDGILIKV